MTVLALSAYMPDLWAEIVCWTRDKVGLDWTEDQIATVVSKVCAPSPKLLPKHIGHVLRWCKAAQDGPEADDQTRAIVALWLNPALPIVVTVDEDGRIAHEWMPEKHRV